jgi:hypothetical protein
MDFDLPKSTFLKQGFFKVRKALSHKEMGAFLLLLNQKLLKNSLLGSVLVQFIERNLLAMNFNSLWVKGFEDQSCFEIL